MDYQKLIDRLQSSSRSTNSQQWQSDVQQGFIPARFAAREHGSATRTVTGAERSSPGTEKHTQTGTNPHMSSKGGRRR